MYKFPLLDIVGCTESNKTIYAGFAFVSDERAPGYHKGDKQIKFSPQAPVGRCKEPSLAGQHRSPKPEWAHVSQAGVGREMVVRVPGRRPHCPLDSH
jgi:hypothetical protein